jgi:phosphoglycerate dehydrogenase-like enzyme
MTLHIVATREFTRDQLDLLRAVAPHTEITHSNARNAAEIEQAFTPATEILYTGRGDIGLERASGLRWVQGEFAGVDHLHDTPIWKSSALLTSANGAHTPHTPEFVLSLMLAWAYKHPLARTYQQQSLWGGGEHRVLFTPHELRGQTVGIVGYGAIGREIARLATSFGMRVLATRRSVTSASSYHGYSVPGTGDPEGRLPAQFFTIEQLPELLQQSDIVVLVLPLVAGTRHLIGATELAQMKPNALLINIGRGGLIDQQALIDAMQRNLISAAALDVTDPEPLPSDNPLWQTPNVTITPHVAGMSATYIDNVVRVFAENLRRYVNNKPLLNIVQRDLGY